MLQFGTKLLPPGTTSMYNGTSKFYLARSLNRQDSFSTFAGESPLHFAAQYGSIEIVHLIFDRVRGPDPFSVATVAPLCLACKQNSPEVGEQKFENFTFTRRPYRKTFVFLLHFLSPTKTERSRINPHEILINLFSEISPRKRS